MFFVTDLIVTFFLNAPIRGVFICSLCDWSKFLSPFYAGLLGWCVHEVNMNRLDTKLQNDSFSISPAFHSDIEPAHRLIVLVPEGDLDYAAATRRVWKLANDLSADIQFISLYKDISRESSLRRQLVTMTAMI